MSNLGQFLPQAELLEEGIAGFPEPSSEFGDTECEELLKICNVPEEKKHPTKNTDSGYSSISEADKYVSCVKFNGFPTPQ